MTSARLKTKTLHHVANNVRFGWAQYKAMQSKLVRTPFGRATSFVVSVVVALNRVNIVAVTRILVLHVGNGRYEHV